MGKMTGEDIMVYDKGMIDRFLWKNQEILKSSDIGSCNKKSLEIVNMYKDYIQQYNDFMKIGHVVLYFLQHTDFDGMKDNITSRWFLILQSVKKQKNFYNMVKDVCKKIPLRDKEYISIKRNFGLAFKRFPYLYEKILPEYLNLTPACSYIKNLEKEGKTFSEDSGAYVDYSLKSDNFCFGEENQEKLAEYCKHIMDVSDTKWKENLAEFKAIYERRSEVIAKQKQKEHEEKKKEKASVTQDYLEYYSSKLSKKLYNVAVDITHNSSVIKHLISQRMVFDSKHQICKVILLMRVGCKSEASVKFYCQDAENLLSNASHATVVEEHFKLPRELTEQLENNNMVCCELVLN